MIHTITSWHMEWKFLAREMWAKTLVIHNVWLCLWTNDLYGRVALPQCLFKCRCCIIKRWKEKQNQNQNLISDIIMSSLKGKRSGFHSICKCTRDIVPTKVLIPIPGFITIVSNRLPSILLHFKCSLESQGFTLIWVTIETVLMLQNNRHFEFHSTIKGRSKTMPKWYRLSASDRLIETTKCGTFYTASWSSQIFRICTSCLLPELWISMKWTCHN